MQHGLLKNTKFALNSSLSYEQNQEQDSIGNEQVENGVRFIELNHANSTWRLGATTPSWRNKLSSLSIDPSLDELKKLELEGLYLVNKQHKPRVALVCGGLGALWPHVGRELYDNFPAARAAMDHIASIASWDVLALMDETDLKVLAKSRWQIPYLFLLEYAQAQYLESLGFKAHIFAGHSIGELSALCFGGAYTAETAWDVFEARAKIIDDLEKEVTVESGMLAVYVPYAKLQEVLQGFTNALIANYNSPNQYILSGPRAELMEIRRILRKQKIIAVMLNTTMAFHHPSLHVARHRSNEVMQGLDFRAEHGIILSNYTAGIYPNDVLGIREHILDLDENAVRWVDCVHNMWNNYNVRHFVEVGPTEIVSGFIGELHSEACCIPSCRKGREVESMRMAVAKLYALGHINGPSSYVVLEDLQGDIYVEDNVQVKQVEQRLKSEIQIVNSTQVEDIIPILTKATGFEAHQLAAHMDLRYDLAMRSSRFPAIINDIEKAFNIQVNFEDLIDVATVGDLAQVVAKIRSGTSKGMEQNAELVQSLADRHELGPDLGPDLAIIRASIEHYPINFDHDTKLEYANISPAVVVGNNAYAKAWYNLLKQMLGSECVVHINTLEQGTVSFENNPALLILVLSDVVEHKQGLHAYYQEIIQGFLQNSHAHLCVIHEDLRGEELESEYFVALRSMFYNIAKQNTKLHFKAISSSIDTSALDALGHKLLCSYISTPLYMHIAQSYISSLALQAKPFAVKCVGLPIKKGHVFIVLSDDIEFISRALQGLAPLACTFIFLSHTEYVGNFEHLERFGATSIYFPCDITNDVSLNMVLDQIKLSYGSIDGLIADFTKNSEQEIGDSDVYDLVHAKQALHVNCRAIESLLHKVYEYGLSYVVGLGCADAWAMGSGSNAGPAQISAIKAHILERFCTKHDIIWRYCWCSIANDNTEKVDLLSKNVLSSFAKNYHISVDELSILLVRELLYGEGQHICWYRELDRSPAFVMGAQPSMLAKAGLQEYADIFPIKLNNETCISMHAKRNFSVYAQESSMWQKSLVPSVDGITLLKTLYDATYMTFPWLNICGVEELFFEQALMCPQGVTREGELFVKAKSWEFEPPVLHCVTELQVYDIAENGRRKKSKQVYAKSINRLSNANLNIKPLWAVDLQGKVSFSIQNLQSIQEYTIARKNIAEQGYSSYMWAVECVAMLLHNIAMQHNNFFVHNILSLQHIPLLPSLDHLNIAWQLKDIEHGKLLDAQVCDAHANMLLTLQGMHLSFFEK